MIGPLSSQLNAIKWGEFRLGDLFEIYTGSLLSQEDLAKGDIVRISVKSDNNGVYGHFDTLKNKKARHFKNFISVNFFGNCFYHPYLASVEMKVHVLKLKNRTLTKRIGLFLANQLNKCFYGQFTYGTQLSSSKLKHNNFKIQLPLKPTANTQTLKGIDFDFMEKFIAELEQCRLAELEAYLKATGLENTTLSSDEENALNLFKCGLTWQSFRLGDLFEVLSSKKIYHANTIKIHDVQIENSYPYVVRAATNNGIKGFIINDPTFANEKNTLSFAQDTFTVFYQKQPYFTGNKVKILKPKFAFKSPKILYFISAILQFILKPLTWGLGSTTESIAEFKFSLPLKPTAKTQTLDDIDFHFMHTFINALMKQTIQGVVQYSNAKIQATKEAISQEAPTQKDSLF
ncbi:restriction endonuclease subunit S [Helicobacter pylori]|nr:restriction endonuclease subunit S [Helicobacter pylori]